jgi:hypothetical protein
MDEARVAADSEVGLESTLLSAAVDLGLELRTARNFKIKGCVQECPPHIKFADIQFVAEEIIYPHFPVPWHFRRGDEQLPGSANLPSSPMQV